jgi:hypothetical protein
MSNKDGASTISFTRRLIKDALLKVQGKEKYGISNVVCMYTGTDWMVILVSGWF